MNIIFDGNYLFHKSFAVFSKYYKDQDMTAVLADEKNQEILIRKCIIDLCAAVQRFDKIKRVVVVFDTTSWRYSLHDDYKYALTKVKEEYSRYFYEILNRLESLMRKKGLIVSRVSGAEGDDLMYVWALYLSYILDEKSVIVTGDSDIRQLITPNVSVFNNNSERLNMYCHSAAVNYWEREWNSDIQVTEINPVEVLLYKVVMGDTSDNVAKLKKGFGQKAFEKFLASFSIDYKLFQESADLISLSRWITSRFCEFTKMEESEVLGNVIFNLKMTWLNLSVYNNTDYITENGKSLLENMLDDINEQKEKYSYNKPFTLENFYGMLMK